MTRAALKEVCEASQRDLDKIPSRQDKLRQWLDRKVAGAPGSTHREKTDWLWANDPGYAKVVNALGALTSYARSSSRAKQVSQERLPPQYFIRFGALPTSGKSAIWYGAKEPIGFEKGISAYSASWNRQWGRWEIEMGGEQYALGLDMFLSNPGKRPAYLLYGKPTKETGEDGEPLVTLKSVSVVKQLQPSEIVVPGYWEPES